ncbi:MAG: putative signal transducing protein [Bryobacteraceae bacterium]
MPEGDLVTVFRSADPSAAEDAREAQDVLREAGLPARLLDDTAPGVVAGSYEVRVPRAEVARAEAILAEAAADDDEDDEDDEPAGDDASQGLDMETVFGASSEMEALSIQSVLAASGIDAFIVGDSVLPNLAFEVRVAQERMQDAKRIIEEAQKAGPAAAEEAEAAEAGTPES